MRRADVGQTDQVRFVFRIPGDPQSHDIPAILLGSGPCELTYPTRPHLDAQRECGILLEQERPTSIQNCLRILRTMGLVLFDAIATSYTVHPKSGVQRNPSTVFEFLFGRWDRECAPAKAYFESHLALRFWSDQIFYWDSEKRCLTAFLLAPQLFTSRQTIESPDILGFALVTHREHGRS